MAFGFLLRTVALWLLIVSSATGNSEFAKFECQEEVSVCKNDEAKIICNSTMDFDGIELYFRKDSKDNERLLFSITTVGESHHQDGMRLKLKNQEATLVIQRIQFSHHGIYRWLLSGRGSSNKFTTLRVSEPPTISKENGSLICRAPLVKAGKRIMWSNDPATRQTEFTPNLDATGLFNLSSSQLWNDSFYSKQLCCIVVDEKGSQELCAQTCYTGSISELLSGTSMTIQSNKQWPITFIIAIPVLILAAFVIYRYKKKRQFTNPASSNHIGFHPL